MRAASRFNKFPHLLAGGEALEEVWPGVHDRPHQPQSLHQHKDLGKEGVPLILAKNPRASLSLPANCIFQVFRINKKIVSLTELMAGVKAPPKTVQLFQLTCWPMGHKVPTSTNSLVELMNMVERWRQRTDYGPVAVVSPDGRSRCGVYCAANACIEQVIQHGEVDIFQAVKTVRRHRPQLVENMVRLAVGISYFNRPRSRHSSILQFGLQCDVL